MKQGRDLTVGVERFPIRGGFTISRGAKHEAVVVVATISDGAHRGRGECVPYARYGESVEGVAKAIEACAPAIAAGLDRAGLQALLPPGAARNALDCALWDLEAKITGRSAAELAGLAPLRAVETAFTISLAVARGDGGPRAGSGALSPAQAQAWRRWRRGAACRHPRRRAQGAAHRRCQRGVARVRPRAPARRGEGGGRRAHRAAAARRRRRSARAHRPHRPGLRRRVGA